MEHRTFDKHVSVS